MEQAAAASVTDKRITGTANRSQNVSTLVNRLLFSLYVSFVWCSFFFLILDHSIALQVLFVIAAFAVTFLISGPLFHVIQRARLSSRKYRGKKRFFFFAGMSALAFVVFFIWYLAFYPGAFSIDSITQIHQVLSGHYSNWHPVWQTLISIALPLRLTGKYASIILFQVIYFALALGYMALIICDYAGVRIALISLAVIIFNPYIGCITMYPWKDVAFSIAGLVLMTMAARIYEDKPDNDAKRWSRKFVFLVLLGLIAASATMFRHNAILFTLPLILSLFFFLTKKEWLTVVATFVAGVFLVSVPLYHAMNVQQPGNRVIETMGVPLTVLGNVVTQTPERMDHEMRDYAYSIASPKKWKDNYQTGNFNSLKFRGVRTKYIERMGKSYCLRMMLKCFKRSPHASFEALFALTSLVYGIDLGYSAVGYQIVDNDIGLAPRPHRRLQSIVTNYAKAVDSSFLKYGEQIGVMLLMMLTVILARLRWGSAANRKKLCLLLPIFIYDFGTMLLLTGPDSRFFAITFCVCPLTVVLALAADRPNNPNNGVSIPHSSGRHIAAHPVPSDTVLPPQPPSGDGSPERVAADKSDADETASVQQRMGTYSSARAMLDDFDRLIAEEDGRRG